MNMTNDDFRAIKNALALLPRGDEFNALDIESQNTILLADLTMINLLKKKRANNKRTATYIANKRTNNKNYAR